MSPVPSSQKTLPRPGDPAAFIASVENERRRTEAERLLAIMSEATGAPPVMWGPSIIGFGQVHLRYESGREGDWPRVSFSPRSTALVLYGLQGYPRSEALLASLGPHSQGRSCVYVKRLSDVDETVLRELVEHAYREVG